VQIVMAVVAVLAAIALYCYLCALAFVYVTLPAMLIGTAAGFLIGVAVTVVTAFLVLLGEREERVLTPADVVDRKLPLLRVDAAIKPDFAWPEYFAAQVVLDGVVIAERLGAILLTVWGRTWEAGKGTGLIGLAFWPLLLPFAVAVVGLSSGAAVGLMLVGLVLLVVTAVAWVLALTAVLVLRSVDRLASAVRRSAGNCPRCYEVSRLPAYRCGGRHTTRPDSALHRDVRPGLLGVLYRRCGCGRRLPTMVLRAARSMTPVCRLCGADLHAGAGAATDLRVPVFGAPSSGKTHLIMAAVVGLMRDPGTVRVTLADEHSKRIYATYAAIVDQGGSAVKTDAANQPIALTMRMSQGRREALLHVYDAAGEALADPDLNARLQYLDTARTLVFVLDPFAIPEIRHRYERTFAELFRRANVSADLPEPSYQATVTRLRQYGVPTSRKRLAFVVSKRDLVRHLPGVDGLTDDPATIRQWLVEQGADNLVTAAERDFGTVEYFFVSATEEPPGDGAIRPFRWLLSDEPVPLPGQRLPSDQAADGLTPA
jgi:hypothetical protein